MTESQSQLSPGRSIAEASSSMILVQCSTRMAPSTEDREMAMSKKDTEFRPGRTEPSMRATGTTTRHMGAASSRMRMVTYLRVSGDMTKQMVKASTSTTTEQSSLATGVTTSSTVLGQRLMWTTRAMLETMLMASSMAKAGTNGPMEAVTKEAGRTIKSTGRASTCGAMVVFIMDHGLKARCTGWVP